MTAPAPDHGEWDAATQIARAERDKAQGEINTRTREGFGPKNALDIWTGRLVAAQEIEAALKTLKKGQTND